MTIKQLNSHKPILRQIRHNLSNNLLYLRKEVIKLSYDKLGVLVGLYQQQVIDAEKGKVMPRMETIAKFSAYYKIPVNKLLSVNLKEQAIKANVAATKKAERDAKLLAKLNR